MSLPSFSYLSRVISSTVRITNMLWNLAFAISILRPLHEFVCKEVWGKRVPELLRIGTLRERSPPHVTGTGLGALGDVMQSARSMRSLTEETVVLV